MDLLLAKGHAPMIIAEREQADRLLALSLAQDTHCLIGWVEATGHKLLICNAEDWPLLSAAPRLLLVGLDAETLSTGYWHQLSGDAPRQPASEADITRAGRLLTQGAFSVHHLADLPQISS